MKRCVKCLMPNTRPNSKFNEKGICQACLNYENRKNINWKKREKILMKICDKYRRNDSYYDCIIPVSGGKDSHFLLHIIKNKMNMNPLLVTVGDPFSKTKTGSKNFKNLGDVFNCDHITFNLSIDLFKRVTRIAFEDTGEALKFLEAVIYIFPMKLAIKFGIPFIIYGENGPYEYGSTDKEEYLANQRILNLFNKIDIEYWMKKEISKKELNVIIPPKENEIKKINPEIIYLSYFYPWSSITNFEIAKKYGFKTLHHEWKRQGCIEDYEQIDSIAYMVHLWLKYPKFGFQRTSDVVSRRIRDNTISLSEGKKIIKNKDNELDEESLEDFCNFLGYTKKEFWDIVDKFYNKEIFEKENDIWKIKKEYQL